MTDFKNLKNIDMIKSIKSALLNRFPQTILITGNSGSGKWELANVIAKGLLCSCEQKKPCGVCMSCYKIERGFHPDLDIINFEEREIPVSVSRDIRKKINIIPNDGQRRVFIIRHAHNMNVSAQNALLKTLEEPPKYAFFILSSDNSDKLLETIRSRCTKYNLVPSNDVIDMTYIENVKGFLKGLICCDEYNMLLNAMSFEKLSKDEIFSVISLLQVVIRDSIFIANGICNNLILDIGQTELANVVSYERLLKLYDFLSSLVKKINENVALSIVCANLCASSYVICFAQTD